jgi:hypothetical protein
MSPKMRYHTMTEPLLQISWLIPPNGRLRPPVASG